MDVNLDGNSEILKWDADIIYAMLSVIYDRDAFGPVLLHCCCITDLRGLVTNILQLFSTGIVNLMIAHLPI